jgi:hypothetical protein
LCQHQDEAAARVGGDVPRRRQTQTIPETH